MSHWTLLENAIGRRRGSRDIAARALDAARAWLCSISRALRARRRAGGRRRSPTRCASVIAATRCACSAASAARREPAVRARELDGGQRRADRPAGAAARGIALARLSAPATRACGVGYEQIGLELAQTR